MNYCRVITWRNDNNSSLCKNGLLPHAPNKNHFYGTCHRIKNSLRLSDDEYCHKYMHDAMEVQRLSKCTSIFIFQYFVLENKVKLIFVW